MELALSLARVVGDEHAFMQLYRHTRVDPGTALARFILTLQRKWRKRTGADEELSALLADCALKWGKGDLDEGARLLSRVTDLLPAAALTDPAEVVLQTSALRLADNGAARLEYVLLALHVLNAGWQPEE